ncbi:hypothetical protein SDRG_15820 [Saprolegnia diclina VS20]|uniref:NADP-dependent oxidoreductase domain-containing protein n=1 Tax=Saprolegnia diclina (strain VS20) TaxID=1156394 RepID=T0R9Y7_SAPDV|nr:hypothetical protein SDRG_15820 [Saprolegnia diclina VS20]EQC26332.1 hypothetical protein SDRG_15820 [Saprolegnia diclina VS20]|eukprot:XP_008620225.1 hypothetical protein SDRG_15820 [Saprolegnia diclina VS20]
MEWSLNTRDIEDSVAKTARELGVGIVAYSPLGRGLLTGAIASIESLDAKDWRKGNPRFAAENLSKNIAIDFFAIAKAKGVTPAQLALAWVLHRGDDVVPIPGTKSQARLIENAGAATVQLTPDEIVAIEQSIPEQVGGRYADAEMSSTFQGRA